MNTEFIAITIRSLLISGAATLLSAAVAVPVALVLALSEFRGKSALVAVIRGMLGVPSVVIGLCIYLAFYPAGPLGALELLYTPRIMALAQALLAFPVILALAHSGLRAMAKPLSELMMTLGCGPAQMIVSLLYETRRHLSMAVIMGFSRVIGETGMTMMVGGNIRGSTRVMTTAITMETLMGNFELAIRLGVSLFAVAVVMNVLLQFIIRQSDAPAM